MTDAPPFLDPVVAVSVLAEPTRRALYDLVASSREALGRDDAGAAIGITRELAAFHLDRLVEAGLLQAEYRRRGGRTGPGAGRPAKLYRRADREIEVSLPARHYERAAGFMATALERLGAASGSEALIEVAREEGATVGADAALAVGDELREGAPLGPLIGVLAGAGYEPRLDPDGTLCLRNCPYRAVAADHRDLTCGMNLAWAEGLLRGLGTRSLTVDLEPAPGRCCVVFHEAPPAADPTAGGAGEAA